MSKEINIEELEKMEEFYNNLICNMLKELGEKYQDKNEEYSNIDIRSFYLGDMNDFYNTKDNKNFHVGTSPYCVGSIENINVYSIYKNFNEIFEYWSSSYYSKMAIYFEGSQIIDDKFIIRIGFALYDYKEFEKSDLIIARIN